MHVLQKFGDIITYYRHVHSLVSISKTTNLLGEKTSTPTLVHTDVNVTAGSTQSQLVLPYESLLISLQTFFAYVELHVMHYVSLRT